MLKKEIYGMNAPVLLTICGIVIIACLLGVLPTTFIGAMAICMVLGFVLGWIGDRIPIWKDYFGGGAILAGIVGAMIFGVLGGLIVGVNPGRTLTMYVLLLMGGGTGAGALPHE